MNQQQRIDRLAEWAKIDQYEWRQNPKGVWWMRVAGDMSAVISFDPFTDLNHARLLLEECERRGLLEVLSYENYDYNAEAPWLAFKQGLMRKPNEITEAVEAVAGLGE